MAKVVKKQSLDAVLKARKISRQEDIRAFLEGKKLRVISNTVGHSYPVGSSVEVISSTVISATSFSGLMTESGYMGNGIAFRDIEVECNTLESLKKDLKLLEKDQKETESRILMVKEKIDYCEKNKLTEFSEEKFKISKLEEYISSTTDDVKERTQKIVALFS